MLMNPNNLAQNQKLEYLKLILNGRFEKAKNYLKICSLNGIFVYEDEKEYKQIKQMLEDIGYYDYMEEGTAIVFIPHNGRDPKPKYF